MKVTSTTRAALAIRRDHRDMERDGWEYVDERGGNLWQMYRGSRTDHQIIDVRIAANGKALWIRVAPHKD